MFFMFKISLKNRKSHLVFNRKKLLKYFEFRGVTTHFQPSKYFYISMRGLDMLDSRKRGASKSRDTAPLSAISHDKTKSLLKATKVVPGNVFKKKCPFSNPKKVDKKWVSI